MVEHLLRRWKSYRAEQTRKKLFRDRRKKLKHTDFSIIANNCWGGEIYKYFDLPFNTPFIGLFLHPDCFLELLENWDRIDLEKIEIGHTSKYKEEALPYPVGILAHRIEIHFLHYKTIEEATTKWNRRAKRIKSIANKNKLFVRFCDRDGATEEHFKRLDQLAFQNKISFSAKPISTTNTRITQLEPGNPNQADDGVKVFWYELENGFDLTGWLNQR